MHKVQNWQQVYNHKINPNKIAKRRYETKKAFLINIKGKKRLQACKKCLNYHIYTRYTKTWQQASV